MAGDPHPDEVKHWVRKFYEVQKQRDELLEASRYAMTVLALRTLMDRGNVANNDPTAWARDASSAVAQCSAAIAKAEKRSDA